jgi:hypothetical protein
MESLRITTAADEKTFGPPREDVVKALGALRDEGWKIIVFSCRETEGSHFVPNPKFRTL